MSSRRTNTHQSSTSGNTEKQLYGEQLSLLKEMFPDWHQDDLFAVISELNGDIERAAIRITEGHADQWTAAGKKVPSKQETARNSRQGSRRGPRNASASGNGWGQSTGNSNSSWAQPRQEKQPVAKELDSWAAADGWGTGGNAQVTEITTVTTVKTDSIITETSSDVIQTETVECSVTVVDANGAGESETVVTEIQKIIHEESEPVMVAAVEENIQEEEVYVRLPSRQNRKLEIEPSAVLLPINVPIKTGSNLVFGYKASPVESSPKSSPSVLASSKVYSPEQLFASAARGSAPTQSYTTTFVETSAPVSSPPGLVPMQSYDRFASKQPAAPGYQSDYDHLESPRRSQQPSYYSQQQPQQQRAASGYDTYGQAQRYEPQHQAAYNQRYSSYVDPSQHAMDASSYYGAASRGASSYYHYAPQMMYGADPYSTAAFSHPSTGRYPGSGAAGYGPGETGYHPHQPSSSGRPSSSSSRNNHML